MKRNRKLFDVAWRAAALSLGLVTSGISSASTYSTGTSNCAGCHLSPPQMLSQSATYGKILPLVDDGALDQSCKSSALGGAADCSLRKKIKNNLNMGSSVANQFSEEELDNIRLYLRQVRDGAVTATPPSFPDTAVGNAREATVSVNVNNYRRTAVNYRFTVSGGGFTLVSPLTTASCASTSTTSASNCSVDVTVRFQPSAKADFSGTLNVVIEAPSGDPQPAGASFTLSGKGIAPIVISPGTLSVGATIGSPTTGDVLVTNQSSSAIAISGIDFSGTHASEFKRDDGSTCTVGGSIAATSNCTLRIRFDPASAVPASRTAAVAITHSAFGSPQSVTLQGNATAAPQGVLEIGASSLSFPDTQLGAAAVLSMTLRNGGSAALAFTAFTIGGTHPSNFEREGNCSTATPLAIAAQCTLTLRFRPSDLGLRSGSIAVVHNGSNPSATISLSGKGIPVPVPVATFDPVPGLAFGTQTVGGLYPPRTLRLTNSGTATMNVASVTIDGAAFSNANAAPCAATLAPAESCDIQVRYMAAAASTNATGTVRIATNAAGSPHLVPLSGSGTAAAVPVLEWASAVTPFDFGNVTVGTISPVQSVTLRNAGPGGVVLSLINTFGTDSSMFAAGSDAADASACRAGRALFEGNTCRIDVRFVPGGNGARSASLQVVSEGSTPPTLKLAGTGMSGPVSGIGLTPAALELGTTRVDSLSAPVELSIQSSGAGVLEVKSMSMSGPFRMQNKTCPATPFTLAAGSACSVAVSFAPQAEGAASGTLTVVSDASPAGRVVALSARAEARPEDSGGGCTISDGRSPTDPTLWVLALLAAIALCLRRSHRAKRDDDGQL